jgi:hypothetical protein
VKIRSAEEVDLGRFTAWVKEAVALNDTKGDPTKAR